MTTSSDNRTQSICVLFSPIACCLSLSLVSYDSNLMEKIIRRSTVFYWQTIKWCREWQLACYVSIRFVDHRRLHCVMTSQPESHDSPLCRTYSCDVSSFRYIRSGRRSLDWDFLSTRTRSRSSWLSSTRMRCFSQSATSTRPVLSADKW